MTSIWFPNNKYPPNTKNYLPCFVLGGGFSIRRKGLSIYLWFRAGFATFKIYSAGCFHHRRGSIAPGHHAPVRANRRKSVLRTLNLLDVMELVLHHLTWKINRTSESGHAWPLITLLELLWLRFGYLNGICKRENYYEISKIHGFFLDKTSASRPYTMNDPLRIGMIPEKSGTVDLGEMLYSDWWLLMLGINQTNKRLYQKKEMNLGLALLDEWRKIEYTHTYIYITYIYMYTNSIYIYKYVCTYAYI